METIAKIAAPRPDQSSVAALPFVNLSDDKRNEYFSDGISEELLTVLQKIPGLHVAARTSAFSFKGRNSTAQEIGEKLGVANLVDGSVRKSGRSVRITARLSGAATGEQLWSDSYTRDLSDVFAVQNELARTIVEHLRGQLGGPMNASAKAEIEAQVQAAAKGGTRNSDAHQLYLQGLFFLNQFSPEAAARAATFLEREVAPTDAEAIAAASELAYAFGHGEAAVDLARVAVSRDPVNTQMRVTLGVALESVGRYDEAVAEFRRVYELSRGAPWGHAAVALVLLRQQRYDDAVREAGRESQEWTRLTVQAQALWALDRKRESDAALARLVSASADTAAFQIAQVYAYRRDRDRAFEWLERAYRQRDPGLAWARSDATLARLYDDARWPAFLARMGLADDQLK